MKVIHRRIRHALPGLAALVALTSNLHAAEPARVVHFSGAVFSATGNLPPKLQALAFCGDEQTRIVGQVTDARYHLDLPAGVDCTMHVGEKGWESQPLPVLDAATAIPLAVLVYPAKVPEPALARELIEMGKQDQAWRGKWHPDKLDPEAARRWQAEDAARQTRLAEIIATKGWPTFSMVGAEAANAAWLVAQHNPPERVDRLRSWVALMQAAADKHEIALFNLATSIDRLRIYEKKEQLYGTQYQFAPDGSYSFHPIEDIARLDQRRLSMGLSTSAVQLAQMKRWADEAAARQKSSSP